MSEERRPGEEPGTHFEQIPVAAAKRRGREHGRHEEVLPPGNVIVERPSKKTEPYSIRTK